MNSHPKVKNSHLATLEEPVWTDSEYEDNLRRVFTDGIDSYIRDWNKYRQDLELYHPRIQEQHKPHLIPVELLKGLRNLWLRSMRIKNLITHRELIDILPDDAESRFYPNCYFENVFVEYAVIPSIPKIKEKINQHFAGNPSQVREGLGFADFLYKAIIPRNYDGVDQHKLENIFTGLNEDILFLPGQKYETCCGGRGGRKCTFCGIPSCFIEDSNEIFPSTRLTNLDLSKINDDMGEYYVISILGGLKSGEWVEALDFMRMLEWGNVKWSSQSRSYPYGFIKEDQMSELSAHFVGKSGTGITYFRNEIDISQYVHPLKEIIAPEDIQENPDRFKYILRDTHPDPKYKALFHITQEENNLSIYQNQTMDMDEEQGIHAIEERVNLIIDHYPFFRKDFGMLFIDDTPIASYCIEGKDEQATQREQENSGWGLQTITSQDTVEKGPYTFVFTIQN
jgi:hypothetical protein